MTLRKLCPGQLDSGSSCGVGGPESALSRHLLAGLDSPLLLIGFI